LDERKQYEAEFAYLQDKYSKDIFFYQNRSDKYKEKTKEVMKEIDGYKKKLLQS
jgi:hypothetical protein